MLGANAAEIRLGGGWKDFLHYGPHAAKWFRRQLERGDDGAEEPIDDIRELVELVMEAWPGRPSPRGEGIPA